VAVIFDMGINKKNYISENDLFQINCILLNEDNKQWFEIYSKLAKLNNKQNNSIITYDMF
jgi:hypothetical protein